VDVSELELDEMLSMSDIKLPEGVSIPALAQGPEQDRPIVSIHVIKEVVIEEEEELEPSAVPVAGEEEDAASESSDDSGDDDSDNE
jgi:large subunit ribosomal protein L25